MARAVAIFLALGWTGLAFPSEGPPPRPEVIAVPVTPSTPLPPCGEPAKVHGLSLSADGLRLEGEGLGEAPALSTERVGERGLVGFSRLVLSLANALPAGIPPRTASEAGPFAEARLRLLRTPDGCPLLRIELLLREQGPWEAVTEDGRLLLRRAPPRRREGPSREATEDRTAEGLRFSLAGARSDLGRGDRQDAGNLQMGYARRLASGHIQAFAADYSPRGAGSGAPYGAVALSGVPWGPFSLGLAAGDLEATLGPGEADFLSPTTLLLRGGGATFSRGNTRLSLFSGRAAASSLTRLPDASGVLPEIGQDRVEGAQLLFTLPPLSLDLAAGWLRNRPQGGAGWENAFFSLGYAPAPEVRTRLLLEGSSGGGWAATVEPRWNTPSFSLGGYYRYTDRDFRPPLGTSLFASLRHGYNLYGSARLSESLSAALSLSQSKSFNLFDPEAAGTLSANRSASLSWQVGGGFSLGLFASASESRSDRGVSIPTRSRSDSGGLSLSLGRGESLLSLRLARETVRDRFQRNQDLTAWRLDAEGRRSFGPGAEGRVLLRLYDGKRPSGERVNRYYEGRAEGRWRLSRQGAFMAGVSFSETPPGPALVRVRQEGASLGLDLGTSALRSSVSASWFRQEVAGQRRRDGFLLQFRLGGLFSRGVRPPAAPAQTRALPLPFEVPETALLRVSAFWDEDGDGSRGAAEGPLPATVLLDGRPRALSPAGKARFVLPPGSHALEVQWSGAVLDGYLEAPRRTVELQAGRTVTVAFPVRPAGRLEGRLVFRGTLPFPGALGQVRITAEGKGFRREAVSDEEGNFSLGALPEGSVRIVVDRTTLAQGVVLEEPFEKEVTIERKKRTDVAFSLRAATARERILQ